MRKQVYILTLFIIISSCSTIKQYYPNGQLQTKKFLFKTTAFRDFVHPRRSYEGHGYYSLTKFKTMNGSLFCKQRIKQWNNPTDEPYTNIKKLHYCEYDTLMRTKSIIIKKKRENSVIIKFVDGKKKITELNTSDSLFHFIDKSISMRIRGY